MHLPLLISVGEGVGPLSDDGIGDGTADGAKGNSDVDAFIAIPVDNMQKVVPRQFVVLKQVEPIN